MLTPHCLKIAAISLIALQAGLSSTHAQRRGLEAQVTTGTPPGLIKKVEPSGGITHLWRPYSSVDEVKVLKSTAHVLVGEFAAKAFSEWKFQPWTTAEANSRLNFMRTALPATCISAGVSFSSAHVLQRTMLNMGALRDWIANRRTQIFLWARWRKDV